MTQTLVSCFVSFLLLYLLSLDDGGVTGKWSTTVPTPVGDIPYTYEFVADGDTLTGRAISQFGEVDITEGKVEGDSISFVENSSFQGMALRIVYNGKVEGDRIMFTRQVNDFPIEEFVASRVVESEGDD